MSTPKMSLSAILRLKFNIPDELTSPEIQAITNNFSEDNLIGIFQFGKLYRGMCDGKAFTVKTWQPNQHTKPGDNETRLREETQLLTYFYNMPSHGCLPKLAGYCTEPRHLAIVYRLAPLDTLNNILSQDSFNWTHRIKFAFGCASVLQFMHQLHPGFPYLMRNLDPAHILIDEDYNPILCEFGMITGGMITDRTHVQTPYVLGCYGTSEYIDGVWTDKSDVYAYGCVLLGLIMARNCTYEDSRNEVSLLQKSNKGMISLVHKGLEAGPHFYPSDAVKITELALRCVDIDPQRRPSMKQVVECLLDLRVILLDADELKIDAMILDDEKELKHDRIKYPEFRPLLMGRNNNLFPNHSFMLRPHTSKCKLSGDAVCRQSGRQHGDIKVLPTKELSLSTNGFSKANLIGYFQFGKLYHGNIEGRKVTVKKWQQNKIYRSSPTFNAARLRDELDLLQHPELVAQRNAVKVIGYCHEKDCLAIVYDVDSLNSVRNLIFKDSFTWLQRIKVIVGFACFLTFLHAPHPPHYSYLIRNIDAHHIMVDQGYNPKLIDFGMISGGIFPDRTQEYKGVNGCFGYVDPENSIIAPRTEKCDVYAFGILVFGMISKRVYTEKHIKRKAPYLNVWAEEAYEAKKLDLGGNYEKSISLVHHSFEADKEFCFDDGAKITRLALRCVECFTGERPSMKDVVMQLLDLQLVQLHAHELDIAQMLSDCSRTTMLSQP